MSFQPKMGKDRMTKDLLLKLMDEDWRVSFRKGMESFFYFLLMFQGKGPMTSYPVHFHDVRDSNKANHLTLLRERSQYDDMITVWGK